MTDRWRSTRTEKPDRPMMVVFFHADMVFADYLGNVEPIPSPEAPWRDERYDLGFWDGVRFCYLGSGHDAFEPDWGVSEEICPTHWAPVLPPPSVTDDNRHEEIP